MNVGDLVKYNYGPAQDSGRDYWGARQGELGVIVDACCHGDPNVAETNWFMAFAEFPFGGDGVSQARAR